VYGIKMYLAPKLNQRIQIQEGVKTPKASGLLAQTYHTIATIWAEIKPASEYIQAVRGVNTDSGYTHKFRVRRSAIWLLGSQFASAFSVEYKGMADVNPIKSTFFIFQQKGSTVKGIRYRIIGTMRDDDYKEFCTIHAQEMREEGTGYPV
jgi:hypothetical protein